MHRVSARPRLSAPVYAIEQSAKIVLVELFLQKDRLVASSVTFLVLVSQFESAFRKKNKTGKRQCSHIIKEGCKLSGFKVKVPGDAPWAG